MLVVWEFPLENYSLWLTWDQVDNIEQRIVIQEDILLTKRDLAARFVVYTPTLLMYWNKIKQYKETRQIDTTPTKQTCCSCHDINLNHLCILCLNVCSF